jgi:hypothetical protein
MLTCLLSCRVLTTNTNTAADADDLHDPGGKLHELHVQAMAVVFVAQFLRSADPSNAQYVCAVQKGISCMEQERTGWLAVRTCNAREVL